MNKKTTAWVKELKIWVASSKRHVKFCEKQIAFWQRLHKEGVAQLEKEQKWLDEAQKDKQ